MITRFTYPVRFRRRADAVLHLQYFGSIGPVVIERDGRYFAVVDTNRPEVIRKWLERQLPGVPWEIEERGDWLDEEPPAVAAPKRSRTRRTSPTESSE